MTHLAVENFPLTVKNVDGDAGGAGVGGGAGVVSAIVLLRILNDEHALLGVIIHDDTADAVVVDHAIIVVPKYKGWLFCTVQNLTDEFKCTSTPHMLVGFSENLSSGLCN